MRQGIASLIADESDMTLVAEAANGREAIQQFRTHRPDITLKKDAFGEHLVTDLDPIRRFR